MNKPVVLLLAASALFFIAACEQLPDGPPPSSTPPANAKFLDSDVTPEAIVNSVLAAKGEANQNAAAAQWEDMWIPSEGWFSTIEKLGEENGRTTVWFKQSGSAMIGGTFWIGLDVVDTKHDLTKMREVSYTGRIEKVKIQRGGPFPEVQISIRNGKVL